MRRVVKLLTVAGLILAIQGAAAVGSVTIGFELYPDATPVPGGAEITAQYASWGVTFDSVRAPGATQVTNVIDFLATPSLPNYLSPGGPSPYNGGTLILDFSVPVLYVGSYFIDDQFPVQVTAYDSGGGVVGSTSSDGSNIGFDWWDLSYAPGIAKVEMAGGYWTYPTSPDGWGIDDLTYSVSPAPGAILLGSIGVSLVGWLRRRRAL